MASRLHENSAGPATPLLLEFETEASGPSMPSIPESPPFLLTHHRHRWRVLDGRVVPALSKFCLTAGSNRVEVLHGGRIRMADARAKLEREGRQIIPLDWGPVQADGSRTYVSRVTTTPPGSTSVRVAHLSVWESWAAGSGDTWTDEKGFADWLVSLVDSGRLAPCSQEDARRMLADARRKLGTAEAIATGLRAGGIASAAEKARVLKAEIVALEAYCHKAPSTGPRFAGAPTSLALDDDDAPPPVDPGPARRELIAVRLAAEAERQAADDLAAREAAAQLRDEQLAEEEARAAAQLVAQQLARKQADDLAARELALKKREADLLAREKAIKKAEEKPAKPAKGTTPPAKNQEDEQPASSSDPLPQNETLRASRRVQ